MQETHQEPRIFRPGDEFPRHYIVESFIGEGASGQVYVVRHRFTGQRFALKVGHLKDRGSAKKMARALVEARAGYAIQHRNVVPVVDLACEEEEGMVWQLMELLEGYSVARLLARHGKLSPLTAIDVTLEAAAGLQAAHELGIIHRDVHPGNLYVTDAGCVKVIDFSLAKVIPAGLETTARAAPTGPAAYLAPEGLKGERPTVLFDVFSLGMTCWQMVAGFHPFRDALGNMYTLIERRLGEDLPSLVGAARLPPYFASLDDVIRGATARDPAQRFQGMWPLMRAFGELRERYEADIAAGTVVIEPPAPWESECRILRDPARVQAYSPPRSLPGREPAPHLPSTRVVLAGAAPPVARAPVAPTLPMAAFDPAAQAPGDVAAPTIRTQGRPAARSRRPWALMAVPPVLVAAGVGAWLLTRGDDGAPAKAPASSAPVASPGARRPPAARSAR